MSGACRLLHVLLCRSQDRLKNYAHHRQTILAAAVRSFVSAEKATIGLVDAIFTRLHSREAVCSEDKIPFLSFFTQGLSHGSAYMHVLPSRWPSVCQLLPLIPSKWRLHSGKPPPTVSSLLTNSERSVFDVSDGTPAVLLHSAHACNSKTTGH